MAITQTQQRTINLAATVLGIFFVLNQLANRLLNKISYGMPKFILHNISLTNISGTIILPVTNKNKIAIPIDGFSGYLYHSNVPIASLDFTEPITITANNTTQISIRVAARLENIASGIVNVISTGYQGFKLKGVFRSAKVNIPIDTHVPIA